jgi:hypothetical protein
MKVMVTMDLENICFRLLLFLAANQQSRPQEEKVFLDLTFKGVKFLYLRVNSCWMPWGMVSLLLENEG